MEKKILVIGSLNMDLVSVVPHLPRPGETLTGHKYYTMSGGKGANQAVAAAKLGANVTMFGKTGKDEYGATLINNLVSSGIDVQYMKKGKTTGKAFITVDNYGENHIVLSPGANYEIKEDEIKQFESIIQQMDIIILQLEIPLGVVKVALEISKRLGKLTVLNPAPAQKLPDNMIRNIDILIPNETELQILSGMPTNTAEEITVASKKILEKGVKQIIVTAGKEGSYLLNKNIDTHIPAIPVTAIDTTAAGDSYIGAFTTGIAKGMNYYQAAEYATKAAALTVTKKGAQDSLPKATEVAAKY